LRKNGTYKIFQILLRNYIKFNFFLYTSRNIKFLCLKILKRIYSGQFESVSISMVCVYIYIYIRALYNIYNV